MVWPQMPREIRSLAGLSAHAQSSTVVIAPDAPPPTSEAQVMTWHARRWMCDASNWDPEHGDYVPSPAPIALWGPHHWLQESSDGYVSTNGHWRS